MPALRLRVLQSASWTMFGFFVIQISRFGGNLVLTRLLFPEAFGMMAIAQSILIGAALLSDVGINAVLVQHPKGAEPTFRDGAWTLQVLRGTAMFIFISLIGYPISIAYKTPQLWPLLALAGFSLLILGFDSTKVHLANRNLQAKTVTLLEITSSIAGMLAMVLAAFFTESVYSLALGSIVSAVLKVLGGHALITGRRDKFSFNADVLHELFKSGRWTFISSALLFASNEGIRFAIGKLAGLDVLGFYAIAVSINLIVWQVAQTIFSKSLFPAYAETYRDSPERFSKIVTKGRLILFFPCWIASIVWLIFGPVIIGFMYDQRYTGSGEILRWLGFGNLVGLIWMSYSGVLLATGNYKLQAKLQLGQLLIQIVTVVAFYKLYGSQSVILGLAVSYWITYLLSAYIHYPFGVVKLRIEIPVIFLSIVIAAYVLL